VSQRPAFFSIVSANYLAYAITLMQTVRQQHPDASRYVFLADEDPGNLGHDPEAFTLVPVAELGIPHFDHFALRYSVLEFNTAVKPFAARWLLARHSAAPIVYLDPDIYVVSPLREVLDSISRGALVVVTPHLTSPVSDDKRPDELTILRVGAYNLGFIALGAHELRPAVVDWWANKLERSAYVDIEFGLFTDQRWIDLVPGLFPDVAILRHPGYNLAYWNLRQRPVSKDSDGSLRADGMPIAFVHFSGVDVRHPELFSVHQNRIRATDLGDLEPLYRRYIELLAENGYDRYVRIPYRWARLRDGTEITAEMRAIFRHRFDIGRPDEHPRPFELTLAEFDERVPLWGRINRYALRNYPRIRHYRPVRWTMDRLGPRARWALQRYLQRRALPPSVRAGREAERAAGLGYPLARPTGLEHALRANVVGYLTGEFGVAEGGRQLVRAAQAAGVEVALIGIDAPETARAEDHRLAGALSEVAPHPTTILCVNADETPNVVARLGSRVVGDRYTVGFWFWELAHFPEAWDSSLDLVDEVWVAADFVGKSVAAATSKPVRVVRMAVDATPSRTYRRAEFGLPDDRFTFLFTFDFGSFAERKNPRGLIGAFRAAFPGGSEPVALVIKTTNGKRKADELDALVESAKGDPRIQVLDRFLSRDELFGLESVVDSYISLHRSEGFGLGLAESMSLGKPVIATAYSGNMEFMDATNSCLVGYSLIPVAPHEYPFSDGQLWAEPDLDQAAFHMRRVADEPAYAAELGRRAQEHMAREFGLDAVGGRIAEELARIAEARAAV
jgi:glycosyltransferase involved in cell wall biosynthesis